MKAILLFYLLSFAHCSQLVSDIALAQHTCHSFQIGFEYLSRSMGAILDQYVQRYMEESEKPRVEYSEDLASNTFENSQLFGYHWKVDRLNKNPAYQTKRVRYPGKNRDKLQVAMPLAAFTNEKNDEGKPVHVFKYYIVLQFSVENKTITKFGKEF